MNSPADTLFAAEIELGVQEAKLIEYLAVNNLLDIGEGFTFDHYDGSIEFHGVKSGQILDNKQLWVLRDYGFRVCWIRRSEGSQERYSLESLWREI